MQFHKFYCFLKRLERLTHTSSLCLHRDTNYTETDKNQRATVD